MKSLNLKKITNRWFLENKKRIFIFIILVLGTFIPIISTGQTALKLVKIENIVESELYQYHPVVIYDAADRHVFWIERDEFYNYTIKHENHGVISTITRNNINYTTSMNTFVSNDTLYIVWYNNNGFFYANRTNGI